MCSGGGVIFVVATGGCKVTSNCIVLVCLFSINLIICNNKTRYFFFFKIGSLFNFPLSVVKGPALIKAEQGFFYIHTELKSRCPIIGSQCSLCISTSHFGYFLAIDRLTKGGGLQSRPGRLSPPLSLCHHGHTQDYPVQRYRSLSLSLSLSILYCIHVAKVYLSHSLTHTLSSVILM